MSVRRILALAEQLYARRAEATALQQELRQELHAQPAIDQSRRSCDILAPERVLWHLSWDSGGISVSKTPILDVLEEIPEGRNRVALDNALHF